MLLVQQLATEREMVSFCEALDPETREKNMRQSVVDSDMQP
jgi:hypothetical protein